MLRRVLFWTITLFLVFTSRIAWSDHCGTALISHEDLLDPGGYPRERRDFEPLDLNRSLVLLSYSSLVTDPKLPDKFPVAWSVGVTVITEKIILQSRESA